MLRWVAILMLFLIFLTSSRDAITYLSFYLNQNFIALNLCENKDKPELKCHGKCVLSDSIIKNHEKEDNQPPISKQEERTTFVLPIIKNIDNFSPSFTLNKDSIPYQKAFYASEYLKEVFHPPSILS